MASECLLFSLLQIFLVDHRVNQVHRFSWTTSVYWMACSTNPEKKVILVWYTNYSEKKSNLHRDLHFDKLEISVAIFSLVHFSIFHFADFFILIISCFFLSSESNFYCYAVIQVEHFFLKNKLKNKSNVWLHVIAKQNLLGCDSQIIVFLSYGEYEL